LSKNIVGQNPRINHIDKCGAEILAQSRVVGIEAKDEIYEQGIVKSLKKFLSPPGVLVSSGRTFRF
jgi:hypothetical protein